MISQERQNSWTRIKNYLLILINVFMGKDEVDFDATDPNILELIRASIYSTSYEKIFQFFADVINIKNNPLNKGVSKSDQLQVRLGKLMIRMSEKIQTDYDTVEKLISEFERKTYADSRIKSFILVGS